MIVKVCGMREKENIQEVCRLPVDYIGFIFYPLSPRYAGQTQIPDTAPDIKRTGVFVNAAEKDILHTAQTYRLSAIQLHGNESPEICTRLKSEGYTLIKAFSIAETGDLHFLNKYEGCTDYFLFDTKSNHYGGSGKQFDWSILKDYTGKTPFLLSGGIKPESLSSLKSFSHPQWIGIDINSGFEVKPGEKNISLLKDFIYKLKEYEQ